MNNIDIESVRTHAAVLSARIGSKVSWSFNSHTRSYSFYREGGIKVDEWFTTKTKKGERE